MKTTRFISVAAMLFLFLAFVINASEKPSREGNKVDFPKEVNAIIEKSCFGCHNTDSRNEDAREDLDFKTFNNLGMVKKVGALREIAKMVEEGKMPPEKFLEKYPERKLNDQEKETLIIWAQKEAQKLIDQK